MTKTGLPRLRPCVASLRRFRSPRRHRLQIRRCTFGNQRLDRLIERLHLLLLRAKTADRDRALLRLALARNEDHRHLADRVLSYPVVDLLVANINLASNARRAHGTRGFRRIGDGIGCSRSNVAMIRAQPPTRYDKSEV